MEASEGEETETLELLSYAARFENAACRQEFDTLPGDYFMVNGHPFLLVTADPFEFAEQRRRI